VLEVVVKPRVLQSLPLSWCVSREFGLCWVEKRFVSLLKRISLAAEEDHTGDFGQLRDESRAVCKAEADAVGRC